VPQADSQHRKGVALIIAAAVAWSTAPFFTRLLSYDSWTILFWRGLFGGSFITLFLVLTQGSNGVRSLVAMKPNVAFLSAFGMVNFIPGAATDERRECRDHHRCTAVCGRSHRLALAARGGFSPNPAGEPCRIRRYRRHRERRRSRRGLQGDCSRLPHAACDFRHDGRHSTIQGHLDGGGCRSLQLPG
jgi:hypothetical protein